MQIRADEVSRILREQIKDYGKAVTVSETGTVLSVGELRCLGGRRRGVMLAQFGERSGLGAANGAEQFLRLDLQLMKVVADGQADL